MPALSNTRLPVGNKDFTNATVVIIGAGISGMLVIHDLRKKEADRSRIQA